MNILKSTCLASQMTIILALIFFQLKCVRNQQLQNRKKEIVSIDSLMKPSFMAKNAALLNFNDDANPYFAWVDFSNNFQYKNQNYDHILGFRYYFISNRQLDTLYYESLGLRKGKLNLDINNCKIVPEPGQGTIELISGNDTIYVFLALCDQKINYNNPESQKIRIWQANGKNENKYIYSGETEIIMVKQKDSFIVKFPIADPVGKIGFLYKSVGNCKSQNLLSFIDSGTGFIYPVNSDCHFEPLKEQVPTILQILKH